MEIPRRENSDARFHWQVSHLYASREAFTADIAVFKEDVKKISELMPNFTASAQQVAAMLVVVFAAEKRLQRLHSYAERLAHQDLKNNENQALESTTSELFTILAAATAPLEPALLALNETTFAELLSAPETAPYRHYLENIARHRPHVGTAGEEAILAEASRLAQGPYKIYSTFSDSEMPFPDITVDGQTVPFSKPFFAQLRLHPNQEVRKRAFETIFGTYGRYANTMAAMLVSQLQTNIFFAKTHHYESALAAALDSDNISPTLYNELISGVSRHLPLLKRYLKLRKRILKLNTLNYHDLYLPISEPPKGQYSYDEGKELILEALKPLGEEYCRQLAHGLDPQNGWVDIYPNAGKISGAYMSGSAYDVHPYVLLNYIGDYDAVSTVAHEFGHAMHSFYSNSYQPYHQSQYSIFIAEIASTFNEIMLIKHLLGKTSEPVARLALLGEVLESFRTTVFRQTMFAEFELAIHQRLEAGEPLTADHLDETYLDLVKRYYGASEGLIEIDPVISHEWAYIPHFYYDFYVYQYATGLLSAIVLSEMVEKEGQEGQKRYLDLLKSGDSDYPQKLLEKAGADLTKAETYDKAMAYFATCLAEAEELAGN